MPSTRSSTRRAAAASSSPASSQDASAVDTTAPERKRKGDSIAGPRSKRERKSNGKAQTKIEDVMPAIDDKDSHLLDREDGDGHQKREGEALAASKEQNGQVRNQPSIDDSMSKADKKDPPAGRSGEEHEHEKHEETPMETDTTNDERNEEAVDNSKLEDGGKLGPEHSTNPGAKAEQSSTGNAIQETPKREESTPSSILEKGLIYFFFRGRVDIDEPSEVGEIARSYIVLRPIPHGAKLGEGPIGDDGTNRLLALPKKVLPASPKDRFMVFVEKANVALEEIKLTLASSDYTTKTVGTRHTPSATPIGEGVYAITTTGRESHLAYILTIPSKLSEVQQDIGLRERGSFVTSVKNPKYPGPANANLPQGPEFPPEILEKFQSRRWMPLIPKVLDHPNAQILLIGNAADDGGSLDKATAQQPEDEKQNKATPLEEIEELEHEDELRVEHLKGDDTVFEDLGLSSKEHSGVQTTW